MRNIEFFEENGLLKTRVEGKLIPNSFLELKTLKQSIKMKILSPAMKDNLIKVLRRKIEDNGPNLSDKEVQFIIKHYEAQLSE